MKRKIYLIGSLRNPEVPKLAADMRNWGHEVFDDWFTGGPQADDCWRDYHKDRGHSFVEALGHPVAAHIFGFDLQWLNWADTAVLLSPAGKSGHLELGYQAGQGKDTFAYVDDPERWDVMYKFLTGVADNLSDLNDLLNRDIGA